MPAGRRQNEEKQMSDSVIMTSLEVENYMRVRVFSCEFGPAGIVELNADNGAGKSSVLTAMRDLLGGAKETPDDPIRHGAKKAVVTATSNLLVSKLVITKAKRTLTVKLNKEGAKELKSPQAVHDAVTGMFIDPEEFDQMERKKRLGVLREVAGVDTTALDAERADVYAKRTLSNGILKKAQGALANATQHDDAPSEEVSVAQLSVDLERKRKINAGNQELRDELETLRADSKGIAAKSKRLAEELADEVTEARAARAKIVQRGEAALAEADAERIRIEDRTTAAIDDADADRERIGKKGKAAIAEANAERATVNEKGKAAAAAVDVLTDEDVGAVLVQISNAEGSNRKVRDNAEHKRLAVEVDRATAESFELTRKIENIDEKKTAAIEGATYPIEGIEARDDDVYLNGVPWEQGSRAERIRASVAMGFAMHPRLKFLMIENGSLLGTKSKKIVSDMAREVGGHVLIETVGDGDEIKVVYEEAVEDSQPHG